MISDEFPAYNVHTISCAMTLMSASSSWTLSYHLVLFPRSQHFMVTSVSMLFAVRRVRLYVTTARPIENTRSDGALGAHTAKSSCIMGARAGYAMFPYEPTNVARGPFHPSRFHSYKHLIALRVSMSIVRVHISSCTLITCYLYMNLHDY